jgi:hypothetical protein
MNVTLQYLDECPNWKLVEQRLHAVLGPDSTIQYRLVESQEDAEQLGFTGSPTVLVDGVDPFANPGAPVGLACRVYLTAAGREGAPSIEQLREAMGVGS